MKQFILILMLALGVTSQAQEFDFSCDTGPTDTEISAQEDIIKVSYFELLNDVGPTITTLLLKIPLDYSVNFDLLDDTDIIESANASMTAIKLGLDSLGDVYNENTDLHDGLVEIFNFHAGNLAMVNEAYSQGVLLGQFVNILTETQALHSIIGEGTDELPYLLLIQSLETSMSDSEAEYNAIDSPHSTLTTAYESAKSAIDALFDQVGYGG